MDSSLSAEKLAYFDWREGLNGYLECDSHIDDDQRIPGKLPITAKDEIDGRQLEKTEFRIEF